MHPETYEYYNPPEFEECNECLEYFPKRIMKKINGCQFLCKPCYEMAFENIYFGEDGDYGEM